MWRRLVRYALYALNLLHTVELVLGPPLDESLTPCAFDTIRMRAFFCFFYPVDFRLLALRALHDCMRLPGLGAATTL